MGKNKFATYRVIISEKARDTKGKYLELLGNWNPHAKENGLTVGADRIKYWIDKGAQMSNVVHNLFLKAKIIEGKAKKSVYISKSRAVKIAEKKKSAKAEPAATVAA